MDFTLNGESVSVEVRAGASALEVLRESCGVTSVKDGCAPQATRLAGREVTTQEGLAEDDRALWADSFVAAGASQCGFCSPGILMKAESLLAKTPEPTREQVNRALAGNLCRCTGYVKIVDAVLLSGAVKQGRPLPAIDRTGRVGSRTARYQGRELALGDKPYVNDMSAPELLHAAVRFSDHPRATIVRLDTTAAKAHPGVVAVLTSDDVPGERIQGEITQDWLQLYGVGETTRYVGDVLAIVAAETRAAAREAAALVEVEDEVLEPVVDPVAALEAGAPQVHASGNLLSLSEVKRGDPDAAFAAAPHVLTETFSTQYIEHAFLEPESSLAVPTGDGGLHFYTQGQGIWSDRRQVASVLGLSQEKVRATLVTSGGGFGAKEDLNVQGHAAMLAMHTHRPVKLTLSRAESIRFHVKRHPLTMTYTVAGDTEGNLVGLRARIVGDTGAYASVGDKVLERAAGHACGPYKIPNVDIEARAIYTNNPPCGAMRGFGANQTNFALEGMMDRLAEQVGIGSAVKNSGVGNGLTEYGRAILRPEADGSLTIYHSWTEMGQGVNTVLMQMACEELGITPDKVTVLVDSERDLGTGQTTASRATVLGGQAVIDAARKLRAELTGSRLEDLAGREFYGEMKVDWTTQVGAKVDNPVTHMAYGWATQVVILDAEGHLEKVIAAHDVGKVINPTLLEGQVEGAVHMGLGHSLSEEFVVSNGVPVTTTLKSLNIIPPTGMPPVECIFVEEHQPEGPYGAKGIGEIGLVPTAGAVAGALYAFEGTRRTRLPMKDSVAAMAAVPKLGARGRSG